jgi:hypothetical protein
MLPIIGRGSCPPPTLVEKDPLLSFGLCDYAPHLCACDIEANPPVIQVRWEDNAYPHCTTR